VIITAYYFLADENDWAEDPTYGASELYVERGLNGDTIDHFQDTYAFQVYTFRYVQQEFIDKGKPLAGRAVLIVPTLAGAWVTKFLDENVDALAEWGERKGL
jgi:hypothetical protein